MNGSFSRNPSVILGAINGSFSLNPGIILGVIIAAIVVILLTWIRVCVVLVKQGTKKVVERFGVYRRTLGEGFHLILKPFDRIALNPWRAIPQETEDMLRAWSEENTPENDSTLSDEEMELMQRRLDDFSNNLNEATYEEDKKYWLEALKEEREYWDKKIEDRLEKMLDIDDDPDYSEKPARKKSSRNKYSDSDSVPSTNMDKRELRWIIAGSDSNRREHIKTAKPTGRYHIAPAGYTRRLDTHEVLDYIDMRECFIELGENPVITLDNASIGVTTCFFYQVTDVFCYYYEVDKPLEAIKKLTVTTLRNLIGSMTLEQTLISRQEINTQLREVLDEATSGWGIKINRVEIEEIKLPEEIKAAMDEVLIADRRKRVKVLDAEAEAAYYLKLKEAEAEGYRKIKEVGLDENVLRIKGYEAVKHLAEGQSTKIFVPSSINDIVTGSHILADAFKDTADMGEKVAESDASLIETDTNQEQASTATLADEDNAQNVD